MQSRVLTKKPNIHLNSMVELRFGIGLKKKSVFCDHFAKNNQLFRLSPIEIISFFRLMPLK